MQLDKNSVAKLKEVNPLLMNLFLRAAIDTPIPFMVLEGKRTKDVQMKYFKEGKSKCDGVKILSKHQLLEAVDIVPIKVLKGKVNIDWNDKKSFIKLSQHIKKTAKQMVIGIVWGGDWDFVDMPHYQLADIKKKVG